MTMEVVYVHNQDVFNIFIIFAKERYLASRTVNVSSQDLDSDGPGICSQPGCV
jgi:hypothetical protein